MSAKQSSREILLRRFLRIAPLLVLILSALAAEPSAAAAGRQASPPRARTLIKRLWGVEVMGVSESAAGYMLEFRYRVLDPEKARPLFIRKTKPVLLHEATGAQLVVPRPAKTGPLRTSDAPIKGRTYWMFFANPGRFVKPGEKVSVVIGDFRAEGLVVQ